MIDALRHAGRAQLSSFAGGSNAAMDEEIWADTPYNESELQLQYDRADELYGAPGVMIQRDVNAYVAGVNQFITEACANPVEAAGRVRVDRPLPEHLPARPRVEGHRRDRDRLAGRRDLRQGRGRRARRRAGPGSGPAAVRRRRRERGSGPTSRRSTTPRRRPPSRGGASRTASRRPSRRGSPCPTRAPLQFADVTESASGSAEASASGSGGELPAGMLEPLLQRDDASNALLVSARESKSGHPVAVMGPQVGYWSPADPDGAGHPRAGDQPGAADRRPGRVLPGHQPLRAARTGARLLLERHLRRPGHHRHLRGQALRAGRRPRRRSTPTTTCSRASACRSTS